jgi:hypothetical protein
VEKMTRLPAKSSDEGAEVDPQRAISAIPGRSGRLAKNAPLMAPTEVPTIMPGRSPLSTRAYSIPTWSAPRLPPPLSTNAGDPAPSWGDPRSSTAIPLGVVEPMGMEAPTASVITALSRPPG